MKFKYSVPNFALSSDWDVSNAITIALKEFKVDIQLEWVEGHQDKKKEYDDLPLIAQLNIDADHIAGEYQERHDRARKLVPMIAGNTAQLNLKDGTVTAGFKKRIRYASNSKDLITHIKRKTGWDDSTFDSVDWKAHERAIGRHKKNRDHITKLIYEDLPTNKRVSRYKSEAQDPRCVKCRHPVEDRDYILRCSSRRPWRISFL